MMHISLFEALTGAGVAPEQAHKVERQLEESISASIDKRYELHSQQLATKGDTEGVKLDVANLKTDMHVELARLRTDIKGVEVAISKLVIDSQRWTIAAVFGGVAAVTALQKLF